MAKGQGNLFIRTVEGIKAHIQFDVESDDDNELISKLVGILGTASGALTLAGAAPEEQRPAPAPQAPQQQYAPRPAAPQGAQLGKVHQACGQPMELKPAGVSKAGRAYPAFFKCNAGCLKPNGTQYTENA